MIPILSGNRRRHLDTLVNDKVLLPLLSSSIVREKYTPGRRTKHDISSNLSALYQAKPEFKFLTLSRGYRAIMEKVLAFFETYHAAPSESTVQRELKGHEEEAEIREIFKILEKVPQEIGADYQSLVDTVKHRALMINLEKLTGYISSKQLEDLEPKDDEETVLGIQKELQTIKEQNDLHLPVIIHDDSALLAADVQRYKNANKNYGRLFGLLELDQTLHGVMPGELAFIYGSPGDGKSTFAEHIAFCNAYLMGYDVVYVSLEMSEEKIRDDLSIMFANTLISEPEAFGESMNSLWQVVEAPNKLLPIDANDLYFGQLTPEQEKFFFDFAMPLMEKGDYGEVRVICPKTGMDIHDLTMCLDLEHAKKPIDLLVIDYLALMDARRDYKSTDWTTGLGQIIKDVKRYALKHKIPIISPHQVNRESRKDVDKDKEKEKKQREKDGSGYDIDTLNKVYSLQAGSQSSETEKSADIIVCIYRDDEFKEMQEAAFACLKNRRGPTVPPFVAQFNPGTKIIQGLTEPGDHLIPPGELVEIDL